VPQSTARRWGPSSKRGPRRLEGRPILWLTQRPLARKLANKVEHLRRTRCRGQRVTLVKPLGFVRRLRSSASPKSGPTVKMDIPKDRAFSRNSGPPID
jgi:hypothetical protein